MTKFLLQRCLVEEVAEGSQTSRSSESRRVNLRELDLDLGRVEVAISCVVPLHENCVTICLVDAESWNFFLLKSTGSDW